ncbi:MAG TPA: hypothetical protein VH392_07755 [Sphingomicrobium sp.]
MDEVEKDASSSPIEWENLTVEQLQTMARGGLAAGEIGAGAHREMERRAREQARLELQDGQRASINKKMLFLILALLSIATLIAADEMLFPR